MPGNPLERHPTWKQISIDHLRQPAERETDTLDTFVDQLGGISSAPRVSRPTSRSTGPSARWMPADQYIGGIEDAILYLFTRASGPAPCRIPTRPTWPSRSPACSPPGTAMHALKHDEDDYRLLLLRPC